MKILFSFLVLIALMTTSAWAQKKVAVVKILKGDVDVLMLGKTLKLKAEDWVEAGSVVKTAEKSFVKLVFIDKSQMNIGPNSEMKIEKFGEKDAGVIDLVKGKIRSQVTKDYLQMDRSKSKLFIKTPNAVMGVRGTDFMISTNGATTSTILFEGAISFNRLDNRMERNTDRLEDIVDRGVNIMPGEFSVADKVHPMPTVPAVLNVGQREALEKNKNFEADRSPGNSSSKTSERSIVPPGLSGEQVSNDSSTLKTEISNVAPVKDSASGNAQGYVSGDSIKPTNGSFLHVESGVIIAPPPGSVFDPNTNSYIASGSAGTVSASGDYIPPKNVEITGDGKILVASLDQKTGQTVVKEVAPPPPVTSTTPITSTIAPTNTFLTPPPVTTTTVTSTTNPLPTTINYNTNTQINDLKTQNQIDAKTTTTTTINVNNGN